jgi:hypothetical protein
MFHPGQNFHHNFQTLAVLLSKFANWRCSQVTRPTDLKNLCLTNKQMHSIAARDLYREVVVEVGSAQDSRLVALVNPKNIGLPYIRKLDLYLAEVSDKCNQLQQANLIVRVLLELLPENILEKFSWHPWSAFSADNLVLLYQKQKRMKWLEAIALDRNVLPELEAKPEFWDSVFSQTRKLGLYPDSRDVLDMCAALLRKTKKVEKITLHASFDEEHDQTAAAIPSRELNDSSVAPGKLCSLYLVHSIYLRLPYLALLESYFLSIIWVLRIPKY